MKIRFLLVCLFCIFNLNSTRASGWKAKERALLETYNPELTDPYITSIKSHISRVQYDQPIKQNNKIRKYFIPSSHFQTGEIPYLLGEEYGDQQKRPLLVYIGGSFSKLFSNITKNFHKRFIRLGYRVLSFENFICDCSISRSPQFPFFDLKTQGRVYYEAIKKVHQELVKQGKVNQNITLFGQSYGGFLGSIIYALDSAEKAPLFNKGLHVYSPPFDFVKTFEKLDSILDEAKKDKTFGNIPSYLMTSFQINRLEKNDQVGQRIKEKSLGVFADFGFKMKLERMLLSYNSSVKSLGLPEGRAETRKFLEGLTFQDALGLIDSKGFKDLRSSQERKLSYWIFRAIENGRKDIRILSSIDDMINEEVNSKLLATNHLMMLPSGGHFGYKRLLWFDKLLIEVYGQDASEGKSL
tara:strand:+ start:5390 stop:6622 length:1233 start_codon:yes stop_codon:yes gene_type:complete